jgi:membrane fusion protein
MVAHLYAPSKVVGFVQVGQSVRLRYQPYPFQRFGMQHGTVVEVSASPLPPEDIALLPGQPTKESLYRVVVRLDKSTIRAQGQELALLPGTALEADIEQAEQRLIDWVISPLRSAATRL